MQKLIGHFFFTLFFVVVLDYCLRPSDVFIYFLLAMCFYSQYTKADVFILFAVIVNFVFIVYFFPASPMGFTCLRSGLSFFASIKICFFSRTPFLLLFIWRRYSDTSYICFTLAVLVLVVLQFLSPNPVPFKARSCSFEVSGLAVGLRLGVRGCLSPFGISVSRKLWLVRLAARFSHSL